MSDSESDFGDDLIPDDLPRHLQPSTKLKTEFKPWHRVRKQFIREYQWNNDIHFLAQQLRRDLQTEATEWGAGQPEGSQTDQPLPESVRVERPLRCLLLPGDEMLDVRSLWQKLQGEGCYLRFLGFNTSLRKPQNRKEMFVIESAIRQLEKIATDSQVIQDSFQDISRDKSQAFNLFRQYGPYDVVNLDLCDSLVPRGKLGETEANYTALNQLMKYQLQHQKTRWLLFVTTQVDHSTANQPEINRLAKPIRENCDQYAEFGEALRCIIPAEAFQSPEHQIDLSHLKADHLVRVFGVMLGKWLISLLEAASPRCSIQLRTSYRYVIQPETGIEMLSLGFSITPHFDPPVDQTGLSSLQTKTKKLPTELQLALGLVEVANRIKDVDSILAADAALRGALVNSKADLLAAAGFDRETYLQWVADGERETV